MERLRYWNKWKIKEETKRPPISSLLTSTALSRVEALATYILQTSYPYLTLYHVGNVGVKSHIHSEFKKYVNTSIDLDASVREIEEIKKIDPEPKKDKLIDGIVIVREGLDSRYEYKYSRFECWRVRIPSIQLGKIEYREIDIFTEDTGIGPIPLEKYDFKNAIRKEYLYTLPPSVQVATQINPCAFTPERGKRAFFLVLSTEIDWDYTQQKLEESIERVKKVKGDLLNYRIGFEEVGKKIRDIGRRFEKRLKTKEIGVQERLEELYNLFVRLYQISPVV